MQQILILVFGLFLIEQACFLSEVFSSGSNRRELEGRTLNAFSMFKAGIRPEWEDPANSLGSELNCRKTMIVQEVDHHWENMVLACIGEIVDENDEICGCRVVDKTKRGGGGSTRQIFRLELWLRSRNEEVADRIKNRLIEALTDGDKKGGNKLSFDLNKRV